jgi:hypothetical protein
VQEDLETLPNYRGLCDWALALAHAKSGMPRAIAGHCGKNDALNEAISKFAISCTKQGGLRSLSQGKARRSGQGRD